MRQWILDNFILTYLFLIEVLLIADVVSQIRTSDVIHCKEEVGIILEGTGDVDNKGITKMTEDDSFI